MGRIDLDNSCSEEQKQALMNIRDELMEAEKTLTRAIKEAEKCYIISKSQIAIDNEIGGIPIKEAFQNELERSMKEKSNLQSLIEKALEQMSSARSKIIIPF
ncbi:MAG: hypothetical protein NWE95_01315 [Candidatus Bathyarchaeota archaeon]|nr:hypothetical protein [Candidatus Bathyarchaeota archaeon]